tara:strand:- start:19 stop:774 length:756 start_codon:yes stop_codon:yes gene_type:complete
MAQKMETCPCCMEEVPLQDMAMCENRHVAGCKKCYFSHIRAIYRSGCSPYGTAEAMEVADGTQHGQKCFVCRRELFDWQMGRSWCKTLRKLQPIMIMEMYAAKGHLDATKIGEHMIAWRKRKDELLETSEEFQRREGKDDEGIRAEEDWWNYVEKTTKDYSYDLYRNRFSKLRRKWMIYNSIDNIKKSGLLKDELERSNFITMIEDYNQWEYDEEKGYYIHPIIECISHLIIEGAKKHGCDPREVGIQINN